jgi:hypothetical protein
VPVQRWRLLWRLRGTIASPRRRTRRPPGTACYAQAICHQAEGWCIGVPPDNDGRTVGDVHHLPSRRVQERAHLVNEHALDLPSHRVQVYHVVSVIDSTLWSRCEDTAVYHGDLHA